MVLSSSTEKTFAAQIELAPLATSRCEILFDSPEKHGTYPSRAITRF